MSHPRQGPKPSECPVNLDPQGIIPFPDPADVGFETKLVGSICRWNIYRNNLAQAFIDAKAGTLTLLCLDLATQQASLLRDFPAKQVQLADNTLCPEYFALLAADNHIDVFGPCALTKWRSTPPLPAGVKLDALQLLPDARGISGLDNEKSELWFFDFTAKQPHWRKQALHGLSQCHRWLNADTVAVVHEVVVDVWSAPEWSFDPMALYGFPQPHFDPEHQQRIKPEYSLAIYQVDFKKFKLIEHPQSQLGVPATVSDIYVSPSQKYLIVESGEPSCAHLTIWRMRRTEAGLMHFQNLTHINRDYTRVDAPIMDPAISPDNIVFYNTPENHLMLYDTELDMHIDTHLKQTAPVTFVAPSQFVMRNAHDQFQCYVYRIQHALMYTVKKALQQEYQFPGELADLVSSYAFSLFAPFTAYQKQLDREGKLLAQRIQTELAQLSNAVPLPAEQQKTLRRFQQAVIDKSALERFRFLSMEHPEKLRQTLYEQVLQEFPAVSQAARAVLQSDPHEYQREDKLKPR